GDDAAGVSLMQYIYFPKLLQSPDLAALVAFLKEAGLDGADMAVRPGYPVTPDNVATELPKAVKLFQGEGLAIGLVSIPTTVTDPESASTRAVFEACGKAGVPAVKNGYFPHQGKVDARPGQGREGPAALSPLGAQTGVGGCYPTHPGGHNGNHRTGPRVLFHDP